MIGWSLKIFAAIAVFVVLFSSQVSAQQHSVAVDSLEKVLSNVTDTAAVTVLNKLCEAYSESDLQKSIGYGEEAASKAAKLKFRRGEMIACRNMGKAFTDHNDFSKALPNLSKAFDVAVDIEDHAYAARIAIRIANIYSWMSEYSPALRYYLSALKFFENINDQQGIGRAYSGIGINYFQDKQHDQALENLKKSLAIFEAHQFNQDIPGVLVNIGAVYFDKKEIGRAIEYNLKAVSAYERIKNYKGSATAHMNLGDAFRLQGKYDLSLRELKHSLSLYRQAKHQRGVSECLLQTGLLYHELKDHTKAFDYYEKAAAIAEDLKMKSVLSTAYQHMSRLKEEANDFKGALEYYHKYDALEDSIFTTEKSSKIAELQTRFETANKEKEIDALRKDQHINRMYIISATGFVLLLVAISFLVINSQRLKSKKNAEIALIEKKILEQEVEKQRLAEEKLRSTLEHNNKSLAAYTLHLIHKNEMLENIKHQVEQVKKLPDTELRMNLNSLLKTVNYSIHLDKDWNNFKLHFEQVHQGFFDKLRNQYPELSPYDLKLCSLIRLSLETKQIATLLDISIESAKVARSRIRKKMGLQMEQNLQEFLQTF